MKSIVPIAIGLALLAGWPSNAGAGAEPAPVAAGLIVPLVVTELDDREITKALETIYARNDRIPLDRLAVHTEAGIVSLSGQVDNLLAKEQAVKEAETLKGVRSVVDRIEVAPPPRSDAELKRDVEEALARDPALNPRDVKVESADGTIRLTGTVSSRLERELATEAIRGVKGVKNIDNDLRFDPGQPKSDGKIGAEIRRRMDLDPRIDGGLIGIDVRDGRVTLRGAVGSVAEKVRAGYIAWIAGAREVHDEDLDVEWWARDEMRRGKYAFRSDPEIEQAIEDAWVSDPRVPSYKPKITVRHGVVTLRGIVDSLKAKRAAEEDARHTVGVKQVRNYIKVRPAGEPDDEAVAEQVRKALLADPVVERSGITVGVRDGAAYLTGRVDSTYQRERAEEVTAGVAGVAAVKNHLQAAGGWTRKPDWEIREDIESQLFWSPFVDQDEVTVTVEDGIATLTGTVDSTWERDVAGENAVEGGARVVRNRLEVGG